MPVLFILKPGLISKSIGIVFSLNIFYVKKQFIDVQ